MSDAPDIDLREQLMRIDLIQADLRRKQQELRIAPLTLMIAGMSAGAAIAGAAAAFTVVLLKGWGL